LKIDVIEDLVVAFSHGSALGVESAGWIKAGALGSYQPRPFVGEFESGGIVLPGFSGVKVVKVLSVALR
jgi:hypothetical protein